MSSSATVDVHAAVAANPLWYHTIEVAPGVRTPGWFDLRRSVDLMPWPDVRGKRCLDVGTYDGFLAFELERRGAAEVVCTDIADHRLWDWPADVRAEGPDRLAQLAGPQKGTGFRIARELLGSSVERIECSVYDLSPDRVGTFDVVVCGTLMLHLQNPIAALEAIRSVCTGDFLSAEEINLELTVRHRRRPAASLNGVGALCQWWVPNAAAHRQMLVSAGFAIDRHTRPYCIRYGVSHPARPARMRRRLLQRLACGGEGVPHHAALAHSRI